MEMKVCSKCKVEKPVGEFGLRRDSRDGRRGECRECAAAYQRRYQVEHKERCHTKRQVSNDRNRVRIRERNTGYPKRHVYNPGSHMAVTGRCAICNYFGRLELHHEDYSQPKDVDGLCPSCHKRVHAAVRELVRIAQKDMPVALAG